MKAYELIRLFAQTMKVMSDVGIRIDDCEYIELWNEYRKLISDNGKKTYVEAVLADRHGISARTIKRIIKRFEADIRM